MLCARCEIVVEYKIVDGCGVRGGCDAQDDRRMRSAGCEVYVDCKMRDRCRMQDEFRGSCYSGFEKGRLLRTEKMTESVRLNRSPQEMGKFRFKNTPMMHSVNSDG
ncbi:unnamed protein product [Larinioides sclopetarius]|uniref:Uncharacterized protein n=1 Tax=Larinioides sclopetarius TaxID=280406 RepID=A0AAV1YQJ4_9ARAC